MKVNMDKIRQYENHIWNLLLFYFFKAKHLKEKETSYNKEKPSSGIKIKIKNF